MKTVPEDHSSGGTVAEHPPHHPEVKGLSLADALVTARKNMQNVRRALGRVKHTSLLYVKAKLIKFSWCREASGWIRTLDDAISSRVTR